MGADHPSLRELAQESLEPRLDHELTRSNGILSRATENILKPFLNAALVEPQRSVAISINEIAGSAGIDRVITPMNRFAVAEARLWSQEWLAQSLSTGIGSAVPYLAAIALSRRGLSRLAGKGEGTLATCLRSRSTACIAGGGLYDGLRVPDEGQTRAGNALAGASSFAVFEAGMYSSRGLTGLKLLSARAVTGILGGTVHAGIGDLVATGQLPSAEKLASSAAAAGAMNMVLPSLLNRITGHSTIETRPGASNARAPQELSSARVLPARPRLLQPLKSERPPAEWEARGYAVIAGDVHPVGDPRGSFVHVDLVSATPSRPVGPIPCPASEGLLFTASALPESSVVDFYRRVSGTLRDFRRHPDFPRIRHTFAELSRERANSNRTALELVNQINANRPLSRQLDAGNLTDRRLMGRVTAEQPHMEIPFLEWQHQRYALNQSMRRFLNQELGPLRRELSSAVASLTDELCMPRLQVRLAPLGRSTCADYQTGGGWQRVQARSVFNRDRVDTILSLGHETAHGHQDVLIMRHLADKLGVGREFGPREVDLLQGACRMYLRYEPTAKWSRAVLALREGRRLPDAGAIQAEAFISEMGETGAAGAEQVLIQHLRQHLKNPHVSNPVWKLLQQLELDPQLSGTLLPDSRMKYLRELYRRREAGQAVDTPALRGRVDDQLRSRWLDLEHDRYNRYLGAAHERDAWNFEDYMRNIIEGLRKRRTG